MTRYTCNVAALSLRDANLLQCLLRILEPELGAQWTCTRDPESRCDAAILDVEADGARAVQAPFCINYARSEPEGEAGRLLLLKPMKSNTVGSLFQELGCMLASAAAAGPPVPVDEEALVSAASRNGAVWSELSSPLAALQQTFRAKRQAVIRLAGGTLIGVDPKNGQYRANAGLHTLYAKLTPDPVGLRFLSSNEELLPKADAKEEPRDITQLKWIANLRGSRETCLSAANEDDPIRLKRWPNFTEMPHSPIHLRLTAVMANRDISARKLAEVCEQNQAEVNLFLNACAELDLLAVSQAVTNGTVEKATREVKAKAPGETAQKKRVSLLRGLLQRLGIAQ